MIEELPPSPKAERKNGLRRRVKTCQRSFFNFVEAFEPRILLSTVNHAPTELPSVIFGRPAFQLVFASFSYTNIRNASGALDADGNTMAFLITAVPATSGFLFLTHSGVQKQVFANSAVMVPGDTLKWLPSASVQGNVHAFTVWAADFLQFSANTTQFIVPVGAVPIVSVTTVAGQAWESKVNAGTNFGILNISRTGNVAAPLNVHTVLAGTASFNTHFAVATLVGGVASLVTSPHPLSPDITIPAGQSSINVLILPLDDHKVDPTLTASVVLARDPGTHYGVSIVNPIASVDILDRNPTVTITPTTPGITEGGVNQVGFVLTRTPGPGASLAGEASTVVINFSGGSFDAAQIISKPASVLFAVGQTMKNVLISTADNGIADATKNIKAAFSPSSNSQFTIAGISTATVNVLDASPTVTLTAAVATTSEVLPIVPGEFLISRSGNTAVPLSVNFTLSTGTGFGTRDVDFILTDANGTPISGNSVTLFPGASSVPIFVRPLDNGTNTLPLNNGSNSALSVGMTLAGNGTNFHFTTPSGNQVPPTVTITNNNRFPTVGVTSVSRYGVFNQSISIDFSTLASLMHAQLASGSLGDLQLKVASIAANTGTLQLRKSGQTALTTAAANTLISAGDALVWTPPALTHMNNQLVFTLWAVDGALPSTGTTQFLFTIL